MFIDKIKNLFKRKDKQMIEEEKASSLDAEFGFDDGDEFVNVPADVSGGETEMQTDTQPESTEEHAVAAIVVSEGKGWRGKAKDKTPALNDFSRLAGILNKDEKTVIEECKIFQIKKITGMLSKAVVRRGLSDGKIKTLIKNVGISGLNEIAVAPAYLKSFAERIKEQEVKVCAVVDFPFGEASFKVKLSEIKNCVKAGVDGVLTVINSAALLQDNHTELKKQLKKISRIKGVEKGVAVNAEDVAADDIKRFFRTLEKTGIDYAAFLFGSVSEKELFDKMTEVSKSKGKTRVKVMANVENTDGVKTLIALGAEGIITPYADTVAKELFKEFAIKSVKFA